MFRFQRDYLFHVSQSLGVREVLRPSVEGEVREKLRQEQMRRVEVEREKREKQGLVDEQQQHVPKKTKLTTDQLVDVYDHYQEDEKEENGEIHFSEEDTSEDEDEDEDLEGAFDLEHHPKNLAISGPSGQSTAGLFDNQLHHEGTGDLHEPGGDEGNEEEVEDAGMVTTIAAAAFEDPQYGLDAHHANHAYLLHFQQQQRQ